ncbi:unnamed protein product, partial [Mesorhabditis spiculigera]
MTCSGDPGNLAVALYGFRQVERKYEAAGIHWEVKTIRDRLALGQCTLPVYRNPDAPVVAVAAPTGKGKKKVVVKQQLEPRVELFDADDHKYEKYLMKLDPNDTKNQDHYKVLGLKKLRWEATAEEIRIAYRQKVLKHHPDKKKHAGIPLPAGEDFFTCITKANEQLGMSEAKRRAYDSVDPKYSDDLPNEKEVNAKNFYELLGPVFAENGRFSIPQPVPLLGDESSSREDVEDFYSFWFNWNTWREYSYDDEQDKEKGEDRWERREMEKANKVERERRRKEEIKRISNLVHMAHNKDPRICKFKKEEAEAKEKAKEERARLRREKQEAEELEKRKAEEAVAAKKREEEAKENAAKLEEKRQKDAAKQANKAQKKRLEGLCEAGNYWTTDSKEKLAAMERFDRLTFLLNTDEIGELCDQIDKIKLDAPAVNRLLQDVEDEKNRARTAAETASKANKENTTTKEAEIVLWTDEEILLLTKAANLYPAGTIDRWIVIADYVNEHRKGQTTPKKTEKQVIKQTKLVQTGQAKPTAASQNKLGAPLPDEENWSAKEHSALEAALKKHPASDPERWEKVATEVPGRTKKDCIKRFKYVAQLIKNQKK